MKRKRKRFTIWKLIDRHGQRLTDWIVKLVRTCVACHRLRAFQDKNFCSKCRRQIPPALRLSMVEYGDYGLQLYSGEVLRFRRCVWHSDWLLLEWPESFHGCDDRVPYRCPEGIYIRIKDIVWCAAYPMGRSGKPLTPDEDMG